MSVSVAIVLPNQLFRHNPILAKNRVVYLIEEWHYFNQYDFHKEKLVLHRASMKFYEQFLKDQGCDVVYIEATQGLNKCEDLISAFDNYKIKELHVVDPIDNWVLRRIKKSCLQNAIELNIYDNPNFLNTTSSVEAYFSKKKTYFQTALYWPFVIILFVFLLISLFGYSLGILLLPH